MRACLCTLLFLAFLCSLAQAAKELELFPQEKLSGGPWRLRADKVIYEADRRTYIAEGQVELCQGDRRLTADYAEVNEVTKIAQVKGNVLLVVGEDVFAGEAGYFNLATQAGEMHQARLFIKQNHFHVNSAVIRKTGEFTYYAEQATVTTCDGDLPVWSFSARKLRVLIDGYATAWGASFKLAGVPVLYSPVAVLPVRTTRQSGFLMPFFAFKKAGGPVVELPFYWVINNHADATFYQSLLSGRGYMQGVNVRRRGFGGAALDLHFSYLNDRRNGSPTKHRYWAAGMVNHSLGDWSLRLTLDRVSDSDYLKDFNFGYQGLNRYSRDLSGVFGRNLEQEEVKVRVSSLLASRNFSWANLTAYGRYYDQLLRHDPRPFHRLPGVSLTTLAWPVWGPFSLGLESSYVHFYQNHGQTGQRLDFHPQLWCRLLPVPGLALESRVGFRETYFRLDHRNPGSPTGSNLGRTLYDVKVSASSLWSRDYGGGATAYRHFLRPEIIYWNMPRYRARHYPDFDPFDQGWVERTTRSLPVREGDDPLGGVNALTYGFTSNLLRRSRNAQGQASVEDVFWFRFTHGVFFNSSSMALEGGDLPHKRFADFYTEMEFYPTRQLTLGLNFGASPYREGFNRAKIRFIFYDRHRRNYLDVSYLFLKDVANQINVSTYLDLFRSVKTWITTRHTFLTGKKLETRYGLILQRQCWGIALTYTDRADDQRFSFSIIIPGLMEKFSQAPKGPKG
ncbi:MAG: LPS-assembly protein LptD [Deltaproteobacteria bacterium]|nr:LPS-assembly protein LptD [Deltaproteobacteria bacterium]